MKVLFVAPRFHTNQFEAAKVLLARGNEVVYLVTRLGATEDHSLLQPRVVRPCALSRALMRWMGAAPADDRWAFPGLAQTWRSIRRERADLVVIRDPNRPSSLIGLLAARLAGARVLVYTQTRLHKRYTASRRIATRLLLAATGGAWFTPVMGEPDDASRPPRHMHFVPFAVPQWTPRSVDPEPARILMIGKFEPRKRHVMLLDALAMLKDRYAFEVTLVGERSMPEHARVFDEVVERVGTLGLQDRVRVEANVPFGRIPEYYSTHNLFVLPSRDEPASIAVLEALASGLPAICSTSCGTRYYVRDGRNGFVFRTDDVAHLTQAIERILSDPALHVALRRDAARIAAAETSAQAYYDGLSRVVWDRWHVRLT
jgi:glycosyltransferase involved in cell wall biosynthesis